MHNIIIIDKIKTVYYITIIDFNRYYDYFFEIVLFLKIKIWLKVITTTSDMHIHIFWNYYI